ncbi:tetratricopeptide repeat protein 28-like [Pocillopora verrucosa]|uniref:tetratricopeptide repeat protein 28-like n=1 Tax=Pocillopora verrucosa TaxID=203993 RepID=UPI0033404564
MAMETKRQTEAMIPFMYIALAFALFLFNSGRIQKAIEIWNECLVLINKTDQNSKGQFTSLLLLIYKATYIALFSAYRSISDYISAERYGMKLLVLLSETSDRKGEASCYGNLGTVFRSLGQYDKAKEYLQKALLIRTEIGDREGVAVEYGNLGTVFHSLGQYDKAKEKGEASCYGNLGSVFHSLGQYDKAKEYLQKALVITTEIGNRKGEASCYGNLGNVFHSLGQFDKAKEYYQKALLIRTEIGDRGGEVAAYGNLGTVFYSLGRYDKAKEYLQKALLIRTEIGDRGGEVAAYGNLGTVFYSLGQYDKAEETEIGDREGEASCYGNLGDVFLLLGQYDKAKEYLQKALLIRTEIGDRGGEAAHYASLGTVFRLLGQYDKAKEYYQKALNIQTEIGDKRGEAVALAYLGSMSRTAGDYEASEVCLEKALSISRDIGDRRSVFQILQEYAILYLFQNKVEDSLSCLQLCIEKYEELRSFLGASDQFKTSFLEHSGIFPYKLLCTLLCYTGKTRDALYVEELGRARGLSDLMVEKYSVKTHISSNPQSWFGIENIFRKKHNCTCLYISYYHNHLHLWILKTGGVLHYRKISPEENLVQAGLPKDLSLSEFLAKNFRSLGILPIEDCEDRSLNMVELQPLSPEQKSSARLRLLEEGEDEKVISSLSLCYKMFIAPVYHLFEEPEVIIVPDRNLYKVPYAALSEKEGAECLSETRRIRVIPSLTTLKIIQDSPEDYHCNTGALIIGNPKVDGLQPLPGARKEAEMVGRLVGVLPLVEEEATKQAVIERISSVSLIHFAAHGSGARSVLVSLWAISDSATEKLMSRFYEHLVEGESASESLHQAMKWMRKNGLTNVSDWASFTLIGDDVKLEFTNRGESQSLGLYEETEAFKLEDCRQKQCCGAARAQEPVCKNDNRITASTDITEIPIIEKDFFHTPRQR